MVPVSSLTTDYRVGLFGYAKCCPVARAELLAEVTHFRQRQKAACGGNAVAADNYRAVMQRGIFFKNI